MNFYVPEIGDEIILSKDWNFNLFPERRNVDLAAYFGHYLFSSGGISGWIDPKEIPLLREPDYKIDYPKLSDFTRNDILGRERFDDVAFNIARHKAEQENPEFVKYREDNKEWRELCAKSWKPVLSCTLPAGTLLKIDRIYIRKGGSDYSSITFYAKNLESTVIIVQKWSGDHTKKKKASLRFWAKLLDCNQIVFEDGKIKP